ncbi:hypothetical protein AB0A74_07050 [Saccharothrix sp. NPDC042600]|uniref:hypothetical protein n=1 Tax=Saccharothrix TaxID=2071 RepID=UPI0033D95850|nr:hypothetical protein GCM10017745_30670 [Saccharothrix mutabilis subsp. capreolus]
MQPRHDLADADEVALTDFTPQPPTTLPRLDRFEPPRQRTRTRARRTPTGGGERHD